MGGTVAYVCEQDVGPPVVGAKAERHMLKRALLVVPLLAVGALTVACDPGISVTFENQTDHEIRVSVDDDPDLAPAYDAVAAGATRRLSYLSRNPEVFRVVIIDESGGVLLDEIFTIEELEARGMRFVVDDAGVQEESDVPSK